LIDDAVKRREEAFSGAEQRSLQQWYEQTVAEMSTLAWLNSGCASKDRARYPKPRCWPREIRGRLPP